MRFRKPKTLVSDYGPEFVRGDLKEWCESLGNRKMESPVYHPRANGLAERAVQTVKRPLQAWSPNLNVSFGAFLQRALMTHPNTSKTSNKNPVELLLGRPKTAPATSSSGSNTCFIQPENSAEKTISESEPQLQNPDVGPSHQDKASTSENISRTYAHKLALKRKEDVMFSKKHEETQKFSFLKFQITKEELTLRTLSISNGHKTKLNSNSVLPLSLSY